MAAKQFKIRNFDSEFSLKAEFTRIYHDHFDRLYYFALKFTKSEDLAKDVVSEVFLNLWKNRASFSEIRRMESYLYISVKNQAIQMLSHNLKSSNSIEFEKEARIIDKIDPEELLLEKELIQEIEKAVATLPPQCQLIFNMAKNKQMKYKEIAEELGITVSTVRMQLIKASRIVKETIRKKYNDSDDADDSLSSMRMGMVSALLLSFSGLLT